MNIKHILYYVKIVIHMAENACKTNYLQTNLIYKVLAKSSKIVSF